MWAGGRVALGDRLVRRYYCVAACSNGIHIPRRGHLELAIPARSALNLEDVEMTKRSSDHSQAEIDNRANQLNPEHDAYWQSRGEDERPEDWDTRREEDIRSEK